MAIATYIGASGWSYDDWQGIAYPERTPVAKRLAYYVQRFDTVEANNTYYYWPPESTFKGWREKLPAGFQMSVKAPRVFIHFARLRRPEEWMPRIAAGIAALGDRHGVLLIQLSPRFAYHPERLEECPAHVPDWLRVAVDFRHPSWERDEAFALLERHRAANCVMRGARLPCTLRTTAPFVYVRFHGPDPEKLYAGSYPDEDMRWWLDRIGEWTGTGKDVYAYFNNDWHGNAVLNVETLKRMLGLLTPSP